MIKDPQNAANEVARYCSRPVRLAAMPEDARSVVVDAFHGRHLCGTWGTGKAVSLRSHAVIDKVEWESLGTWSMILGAQEIYPEAAAILKAWLRREPVSRKVVNRDLQARERPDDERAPPEASSYPNYLF